MTGKPTLPEVADAFRAYLLQPGNAAWGSLHVVLDDGNIDNASVQHCIDGAIAAQDHEGERLARVLLTMSKTQRAKLPFFASRGT